MTKTRDEPTPNPASDPFVRMLRRVLLFLLAAAMLVFAVVLMRARQSGNWPLWAPVSTPVHTGTSTSTLTTTPTETTAPATPAPPAGEVITPSVRLDASGTVFFSMIEAGHWRLYAYHPQDLPFTRLTTGDWDDTNPAASPDGARLAFASNRDGSWDLYSLEITTGRTTRITNSPEYDGSPSWSPDGLWLAYETYTTTLGMEPTQAATVSVMNLEVFIRPLDASQAPIRLTTSPGIDFSPAWSPGGRQIAFVSNRSGEDEIWLADLDQVDNRFHNVSRSSLTKDRCPAWSPAGERLAWSSNSHGYANILVFDPARPQDAPSIAGGGNCPAWSPDGAMLLTGLETPNRTYLTGYASASHGLALPPIALPGALAGISWGPGSLASPLPPALVQAARQTPAPAWLPALTPDLSIPDNRQRLVTIADLDAPYPILQDMVDESFVALRGRLAGQIGWDLLSSLESAFVPLTSPLFPGMQEDWLYTGRSFSLNTTPINAGWMVVMRDDTGQHTYWRVYVRTRFQDGSQGRPLTEVPWNFNARYSGDPRAYEEGGAPAPGIPPGYWFDLTTLAAAYGWERLPALNTWRFAVPAARFNEFAFTSGMDWLSAMREIYPSEALNTPTAVVPPTQTPTTTRRPSLTPTPTRTRFPTRTPTVTRTLVPTRTP